MIIKKIIKKIILSDRFIDSRLFLVVFYLRQKIFRKNQLLIKLDTLVSYESNIIKILKEKEVFFSVGPKTVEKKSIIKKINLEKLCIYQFDNAVVNVRSSCVLYNNRLLVERKFKNERYNESYVINHGYKKGIIQNYNLVNLEEAIFLGGNGCWNWYHFLIEVAPKLLFKAQIPCKHIILSSDVLKYRSMQTVINILLGNEYKVTYLDPIKNYKIKKLYHINNISYTPFNVLNNKEIFGVEDVYMRSDILIKLRNKLISHLKIETKDCPKNIFLKRKEHRVAKNQEELINRLKKYNFKEVYFEELNLEEQIRYMYNAEFVIGTTGAAWTNILFANSGLKAICFMQDNCESIPCFSNLANIFGVDLNYYYYLGYGISEHYRSDYKLDIESIENIYLKMKNEKS